jgi:glyoxylase-like metal-dependent hydrolase (beta-lactamase superfamily II)
VLEREAAPGIHRVEDAYTNWFLVEGEGRSLTVVDTGFPRSWTSLRSALRALGRSTDDVGAVVLTHGHFDHMGFARRARRELGVEVWAPERERPVVSHPWHYDHERSRVPYFLRHARFRRIFAAMGAAGALWVRGTDAVRGFADGALLDVPGRPVVVPTPGHTHGHCSLHLPDRDALIAGDAVVTLDPYTGGEGPQIVSGAATADSARALASLDAVAATGARVVLPGHGEPWRDGAERAAQLARSAGPS